MKMIIGGQKKDAQNGAVMDIFNPANGQLVDTVPQATLEDVASALEHALTGKKVWRNTPLHERAEILLKFAAKVSEEKEALAQLLCEEMGKPIKEARMEIGAVVNVFKSFVSGANHLYGITLPDNNPGAENDVIFTKREPLGVVACIIPFNFPASTFAYKVAPALIVGNAVITKPPSDNPLTLIRLTELLLEAGVPSDVIQIVTGSGSTVGNYLVNNPNINAISLTGSTAVGIQTLKTSADHMHRVFLELGGNDAVIILEDADIELAVNEAILSRTTNAGQICIATKRFIIHRSVKEAFVTRLVERLETLKIGNPADPETDMGCLINEKEAQKIKEQVEYTLAQGAKCVYGGKLFDKTFFEPTVLVDVTPEMDIAKDMEVFGPVFPIIEFDTIEEAIAIHNTSSYGLNGAIISQDMKAMMKIAEQLECGSVIFNGNTRYRHPHIAFGGYKMSGLGREGVTSTLEELTQVKTYIMKGILS